MPPGFSAGGNFALFVALFNWLHQGNDIGFQLTVNGSRLALRWFSCGVALLVFSRPGETEEASFTGHPACESELFR
ncbi:conserved hypothetical protein [delta proteobacterium NaphS2]|nr:conserved hypothetical protein [delta proteobacterium NaphS2]